MCLPSRSRTSPFTTVAAIPRALHEPPGTGREVVSDLRHLGSDRLGVEDDQVGGEALADEPAVGEAPEGRRHESQHVHRVLEREDLPLANPVAQERCV